MVAANLGGDEDGRAHGNEEAAWRKEAATLLEAAGRRATGREAGERASSRRLLAPDPVAVVVAGLGGTVRRAEGKRRWRARGGQRGKGGAGA
jgi:hypothetical protein